MAAFCSTLSRQKHDLTREKKQKKSFDDDDEPEKTHISQSGYADWRNGGHTNFLSAQFST